MKKVIFIAAGIFGLVMVACKKDDDGKAATVAQLLTTETWRYDTVTLDLDKNGTPDSSVPPGYIEACDLDNTVTFKSDLTGVNDEGATKCDDADPQTTGFTWSLSNNDSTLNIVGQDEDNLNGQISIKEITNSKMVLVKNITITDVITLNANVIITLKK